jgi:catechol 2,3-dioxygenase-like lactoylglutathione lyase family enzyme
MTPRAPEPERPFAPASLDHVVLRATAIEPMLRFYRDVLGCTVAKHNEPLGLWHLRAGPTMIDLIDVHGPLGPAGGPAPGPQGHNLDHLCLRLRPFDPDAVRAFLAAQGIATEPPGRRFGAQGDGLSIYLKDPQGNGIELRGDVGDDDGNP